MVLLLSRGIRPHLTLRGKIGVSLKLCQGPQGTSRVATVESGLLSSCKGTLGLLSSHYSGIGPHLELIAKLFVPLQV